MCHMHEIDVVLPCPLPEIDAVLECQLQEIVVLALELLVLFPRDVILDFEDAIGVPVDELTETTARLVFRITRPKVTLALELEIGRDNGQNFADCVLNGILSSAFFSFIGS